MAKKRTKTKKKEKIKEEYKEKSSFKIFPYLLLIVGLVLISQAITALYISHIHAEAQGRPLYIVDRKNSRNLKK